MKSNLSSTLLCLCLLTSALCPPAFAQGTAFTYQAQLDQLGGPGIGNFDLSFSLFTGPVGPGQVGNTLTNANVAVSNGLVNVTLDFGAGIFTGADRWLELAIRTNGSGSFTILAPRQQLTPTPYAITAANLAGTLPAGSLSGVYSNALTFSNATNTFLGSFTGNGAGLTNLNAVTFGGLAASNFWQTSGNSGTTAGTRFLGTTDNQPLEVKVNGMRALRIEPNSNGAPNIIFGSPVNFVDAGVKGASISGGGLANPSGNHFTNRISADFGYIGGGYMNWIQNGAQLSVIAGGIQNTIETNAESSVISGGTGNIIQRPNGSLSVIGGGLENVAAGTRSTISGGQLNVIDQDSFASTIAGGEHNLITSQTVGAIGGGALNEIGSASRTLGGGNLITNAYNAIGGGDANLIAQGALAGFIGGGLSNTINTASYATVPGGRLNQAGGDYSLAAGRRAKANHDGAFVWADSTDADFASTAVNQFLIRAAGGVGIGTTTPEAPLHVADGSAGTVTANPNSIAVLERSGSGYLTLLSPVANETGILFGSPTNNTDGAIVFNNASTTRGLQIRTSGNITKMVIQANGNVGIGTLTPDGPLDITTPVNTNCSMRLTSGGSWPLILNQSPSSIFSISNGGVARLIITPAGLVGVGRTATANDLEVEGTASKTTAGSWLANSDARIKTGVRTVTNALATLARVRLVRFHYTEEYRAAHPSIADREYLNVVAQEFQEVFPEQVQRSGEKLANGDPILQVDTYPLTIYAAAAVQELSQKVEGLQSELKRRDAENAELKQAVNELKTLVHAMNHERNGSTQ